MVFVCTNSRVLHQAIQQHITSPSPSWGGPGWGHTANRISSPKPTDENRNYEKGVADYQSVNHAVSEYVRSDAHPNTVEGYFSIFERGLGGIYQNRGKKHLHRYLAEIDIGNNSRVRFSIDDEERNRIMATAIGGVHLTYRRASAYEANAR